MADLAWFAGHQFSDDDGDPLNAGTIEVFDAGTTNERTVYQDSAEAVPWTQPITLDSAGRLTSALYVPEGNWKYTLKDSGGSTIVTQDNIPGAIAAASAAFAFLQAPILSKAANYTLTTDDLGYWVRGDASGGAFTLTLPSATTVSAGKGYWLQNTGTNGAVTVATTGGQTINGASTFVINPQYGLLWVESDGANWVAAPVNFQWRPTPSAKTSAYTVKPADDSKLIPCDGTSAGFTVTLPPVGTVGAGFRVGVKKTDSTSNVITVDGDGSETIDGATTFTLNAQNEAHWFQCNGTVWLIENPPRFGAMAVSGTVSMSDNTLSRPKLLDYGETVNALGSGGGARTIDLTLGNVVTATVSSSTVTWTFSNPPASGTSGGFVLILTNGGSQTVNWPASVDWPNGGAPALTSSGRDVLSFLTVDGGTIWYGFVGGLSFS